MWRIPFAGSAIKRLERNLNVYRYVNILYTTHLSMCILASVCVCVFVHIAICTPSTTTSPSLPLHNDHPRGKFPAEAAQQQVNSRGSAVTFAVRPAHGDDELEGAKETDAVFVTPLAPQNMSH